MAEVRPVLRPGSYHTEAVSYTHLVKKILIQRVVPVAICIVFIGGGFYYAKENDVMNGEKLVVYNWGEYIDPEVLTDVYKRQV